MSTVKMADVSKAVMGILEEYGDEAVAVIREEVKPLGRKAIRELRAKSPKLSGNYAKGWRLKGISNRLGGGIVVYNETDYQLTHLLENGHANRDGSRTAPIEHIGPVNDEIQEEFVRTIEERLS